jgi:hypothetical protein
LWQGWHSTQRLSGSHEPPRATGTMWSTSRGVFAPHCWQVKRSLARTRALRRDQSRGREAFRALALSQLFRSWCAAQRPSRRVGVRQPDVRQMLLALGISPQSLRPRLASDLAAGADSWTRTRSLRSTSGVRQENLALAYIFIQILASAYGTKG